MPPYAADIQELTAFTGSIRTTEIAPPTKALHDAIKTATRFSIRPYLSLLRFSYHQNFAIVIGTAAFFQGHPADSALSLACKLLQLYFSFNICLYGSLYSINAITDADEDAQHPEKKYRPVASGAVSKQQCAIFIALLQVTAFISGYMLFGPQVCAMYLLFIVLNLTYSLVMRNMKFMRFWTAGLTSPARMALAAIVFNANVNIPSYFCAYFFMTALQSSKIRIENRKLNEEVNGFKPGVVEAISFIGTAIALYFNYPKNPIPAFIAVVINTVYVVLPNINEAMERRFRKLYTADC